VDPSKCNGCGACVDVCPVYQPNRYDVDLKPIKAIYAPFAQAVPLKYVINKDICTECGMCQKACGLSAINFNDHPKTIMLNVGAIVIATGASLFDPKLKPQYHYGEFENVISSIEFERVICASGPSGGELVLRNRKHPKRIAFIQCVGSRDTSIGAEDCSLFCCAVSLKQARLIKEHDPKAEVYIFYTDIRTQGKGWEDLYTRVREDGVRFIRCRPSELRRDRESGEIVIPYEDSLTGERGELKVDLVVLALGMRPSESTTKLAKIAGLQTRDPGWIEEIQPKFRPLETFVDGIFIAGTCHGPRDISESVIEGSGAAGLVLSIFNASELALSPFKASVDKLVCTGCMRCQSACEYGAITSDDGKAAVNEGVCKGCGACVPACLPGAISLKGWQQESVLSQVEGILEVP
jgi:heterodisulfide reductase subunit A